MYLQKGNIRLERILATVLFVGFMTVFVYKVLGFAEVSERMLIESRITQLKAAMDLKFAELMMTGQQNTAVELENTNPIVLFEKVFPQQEFSNYMGEQWQVQLEDIKPGSWVFDNKTGVLLYKLKNQGLVTNLDPEPLRLQWQIKATLIEENSLVGKGTRVRVESLKIVPIYKFEWNY